MWKKPQFIHTINGDVSKTANIIKGNDNLTYIDIQATLLWLTLLFYDFCVAINSVYKLQFFTSIVGLITLGGCPMHWRDYLTTTVTFCRTRVHPMGQWQTYFTELSFPSLKTAEIRVWKRGVIRCQKAGTVVQDACRINACRFSAGSVTVFVQVPIFLSTTHTSEIGKSYVRLV